MNTYEPIWINHPVTGQTINIAPLLEWLDQFDAEPDAPTGQGAADAIRRITRAMNLATQNPTLISAEQVVDLYVDLHRLEDMFGDIPTKPEAEGDLE